MQRQITNPENLNVGIYCRLSRDDGNLGESGSIQNQKDFLADYAIKRGFTIVNYYIDDGYSGTNFDRPGFKNLISDIENKKIEYWKSQLLDTGKRNKMINYRETARATLKIVEPGLDELYANYVQNENELTFEYPLDKDSDIRTYSVLRLFDRLSCPIPVLLGEIKVATSFQESKKTLKNLRNKSKLALEDYLLANPLVSDCHGGKTATYTITKEKWDSFNTRFSMHLLKKMNYMSDGMMWNATGEP